MLKPFVTALAAAGCLAVVIAFTGNAATPFDVGTPVSYKVGSQTKKGVVLVYIDEKRVLVSQDDVSTTQRVLPASALTNLTPTPPPPPPPPPPAACADGADNDSDGLIDLADPGCADAADNDEFNEPAPPPPPPPPPSGVTVAAGQSWQTAYNNAASGSTITVLAGSHGIQRVEGSKPMTFLGQDGAVLRQLWNYASGLTLDNVDIDGGGQKLTILESHAANATYRNLEIRNNTDIQMVGNYGSNGSYDNVFFHDAVITSAGENSGVHMECVWSNGPAAKFRNSVFKDCAIMDLYLTLGTWWSPPQQPYTDVVVENNVFWPSERANNTGTHFYGFLVNGNLPINGWSIRNNDFKQDIGVESPISNSVICGNIGVVPASWKVAC